MPEFNFNPDMDILFIVPSEIIITYNQDTMFRERKIDDIETDLTALPGNLFGVKFFRENLGVSMLKAFLGEHGYYADILYMNEHNEDYNETIQKIISTDPLAIGLSILYNLHLLNGIQVVRDLRKNGYKGKIILGGPCASLLYEIILTYVPMIDIISIGEGENTILHIIEHLKNNLPLENIRGISYRKSDGQIVFSNPEIEKDLDNLPFTDRSYLKHYKEKLGSKFLICEFFTSRGCNGNCIYCSAPDLRYMNDVKWRCRSINNIIKEIKYLVENYKIKYFSIIDENFFGYGKGAYERLNEFADILIESNMNIIYRSEMRTDIDIDDHLLEKLKKAGLSEILLGIESGSQSVLNRWKKGTKIEKTRSIIEMVKRHRFQLTPAFIMMDPYMTKQEFIESVEFIRTTKIYECEKPLYLFNELIVFPGTEMERILLRDGIIEKKKFDYKLDEKSDDEKIHYFCANTTFYYYQPLDDDLKILWKYLKKGVNDLTYLVESFVPRLLKFIYNKFSSISSDEKKELLEFIRQYKLWVRSISMLSLQLLETSVRCLKKEPFDSEEYQVLIFELIEKSQKEYFGDVLSVTAAKIEDHIEKMVKKI